MIFPLYSHQQRFLSSNPPRALLAHGTGTGKTRTACEYIKQNNVKSALIVCPKGLIANWEKECERWGVLPQIRHIVSKETFKLRVQPPCECLIVDEADHFFSAQFKSKLSKALRAYIQKHSPRLLLLSATPYRSSPWNIHTAATLLGHRWNYQQFRNAFFFEMHLGPRTIWTPKKDEKTKERLKRALLKIADVVSLDECIDVPPQIEETIEVGETKEQMRAKEENNAVVPIVRFTREHQIENGFDGESEKNVPIENHKMERIIALSEEHEKLIIVCRYRRQMEYIAEELNYTKPLFMLHGDIPNRAEIIQKAEEAPQCVLIIQSSVCEGYELPSFSIIVFASLDFSYRNYLQMKGRVLRINSPHRNLFLILLAGKADKAVWKALQEKKDFDVTNYYA